MRYFNEHRRKLIKQNYIRGTKATAQGANKLVLENSLGILKELKIEGNCAQGKILPREYQRVEYIESTGTQYIDTGFIPSASTVLDTTSQFMADYTNPPVTRVSGISTGEGRLGFGHAKSFETGYFVFTVGYANVGTTVSFDTNKHRFRIKYAEYASIDDYVVTFGVVFEGKYSVPIFAAITKNGIDYFCDMRLYDYKLYDGEEIKRDFIPCYRKSDNVIGLYDLVTETFYTNQGTGVFLKGEDISISPNQPQNIDVISNAELTFRGANLLNPQLYRKTNYVYQGIGLKGQGDEIVMTGTALASVYNSILSTPDKTVALPDNMRGKKLYFSKKHVGLNPDARVEIGFYDDNNNSYVISLITNEDYEEKYIPENYDKWWIRVRFSKDKTYDERIKIMISDTPHTEYEPYVEPHTCEAANIDLAGIKNAIDTIRIDYASKKVIKTQRVLYKSVGELIDAYGAEYDGIGAICINNDQPRMEIYERNIPYYCTHFISYHDDPNMGEGNPRFEVTASGQILFYYPPLRSVEEFKAWCYENDVKIAYVLENEHQIDITNTEAGQNLLNLTLPEDENVIFEVSADLAPSNVSLEYYSKTKEDKRKITVHYNDTDGNAIYESQEYFVRRDSICEITYPEIDGYKPKNESVCVLVANDTEITLIYNKK